MILGKIARGIGLLIAIPILFILYLIAWAEKEETNDSK